MSMKCGLVILDPNTEKIEGFYKADNFINDIKFGNSLFALLK